LRRELESLRGEGWGWALRLSLVPILRLELKKGRIEEEFRVLVP
jgi:hypothetical protein